MKHSTELSEGIHLEVENIGGITETELDLEPGVNVLSGRNATNRTSLLRAIMAALGSDDVSLKSDTEEGYVALEVDGETYTRRLVRKDNGILVEGEPYLDDPQLADLFAFLLATNETREAVMTEHDLRELIMRPIDTEAIQREVESLTSEARQVDSEIEALSTREDRLGTLSDRRAELADEINEKEAELADIHEEIEAADTNVEESREEKRAVEEKMSSLGDRRSKLDSVRQELRAQRNSLQSLHAERDELMGESEDLPASPEDKIDAISAEIDDRRTAHQRVESEISTLQRIIQYNEENLEGASSYILEALSSGPDHDSDSVADELVTDSETVVCWTCGHKVEHDDIEETLADLRQLQTSKLDEKQSLETEIDELETDRIHHEEKERQREQVQRQLERTVDQIEVREEQIESLESDRDALEDEIAAVEREVEDLQTKPDDEILDLHKAANELEVELNRLEKKREAVTEEIAQIEADLDHLEELEARRESIREELTELRTRIDRIEAEAVESFNEEMDTVLEVLEYENLARIWIERKETEVDKDRRKMTEHQFEMHIVRESEDGRAYEDTIRHLSESEREVTGLVFALAGYLAHDVHEVVPFMLLDSLEAIDSDRIAKLLDYFETYPDYLIAALLPEDAAATDDDSLVTTEI